MTAVLQVENLSKEYKQGSLSVLAVKDVSFSINPGEFVAIVGPSGSGKTTLLAMLATLLTPSSGSVNINGIDLSGMSEKQRSSYRRSDIGFTFQANNLIPYLTVLENVELMLRLNKDLSSQNAQKAVALIERLGLAAELHKMPNQLSGGQQQRVAIARALVHDPSLVLVDEPTASLDTERAFQVVETFTNMIHEQNKAGIMVTHDLRMVAFADKVIKMVDGEVQEILDTPEQISQLSIYGANPFTLNKALPIPSKPQVFQPAAI